MSSLSVRALPTALFEPILTATVLSAMEGPLVRVEHRQLCDQLLGSPCAYWLDPLRRLFSRQEPGTCDVATSRFRILSFAVLKAIDVPALYNPHGRCTHSG